MSKEVEFIDGLFVSQPSEASPDFVKLKISIKRKSLGNWLRGKQDEWINIQVKESKNGKWYAEVDNWKPENKQSQSSNDFQQPPDDGFDDDVPF